MIHYFFLKNLFFISSSRASLTMIIHYTCMKMNIVRKGNKETPLSQRQHSSPKTPLGHYSDIETGVDGGNIALAIFTKDVHIYKAVDKQFFSIFTLDSLKIELI